MNSGMTMPTEQLLPHDLYPISDNELARSRLGDPKQSVLLLKVLESFRVSQGGG